MNCPQCGQVVAEGATSCSSCGAQIAPVASAMPPGVNQPAAAAPAARASSLPVYKFDLKNLSLFEQIGAGATLLLFISLFLDWYSYSIANCKAVSEFGGACGSSGQSALGGNGFLYLTLILCLVLLAIYGAKLGWGSLPFKLPFSETQLFTGLIGLNFFLFILGFFLTPSAPAFSGISVGWDYGAFIGLIAGLATLVPIVVPAIQKRSAAS